MLKHVAVQWVLEKTWVHIAACKLKLLHKVSLFPVFLRAKTGIVVKLSRKRFLTQPSDSLSNRPTVRRSAIWSTDSIFEENMSKYISMYCLMFFFEIFYFYLHKCPDVLPIKPAGLEDFLLLFLGLFAELWKATINFLMSACPSARMYQHCSHWTYFNEIWYLINCICTVRVVRSLNC